VKQLSLELAKHKPAQIWMAVRSPEKDNEAVADVRSWVPGAATTFLELDLSCFDSIKSALKIVLMSSPRRNILILNAGRKQRHSRDGRMPPKLCFMASAS